MLVSTYSIWYSGNAAAVNAWIALAVTDTTAQPARIAHGYQEARLPARETTTTVASTMIPSTISGHAQACPAPHPDRGARAAREVDASPKAPTALNTVPPTAGRTPQR